MNARFDYLKTKEIRIAEQMDSQIDKKNRMRSLRLCLGVLKKYSDETRGRRQVIFQAKKLADFVYFDFAHPWLQKLGLKLIH